MAEQLELAAVRGRGLGAAPALWARLYRRSQRGLDYLRQRALEDALADVRFSRHFACAPLRDADGVVVNVVGYRFQDGEPRLLLAGCSLGMFGHLGKVAATAGTIVLVSTFRDWAAARVLTPRRLVLGAHAPGRLPDVARLIAPVAAARRREILLVPPDDDIGTAYTRRARAALVSGGVPIDAIDSFSAGDLRDYLLAVKEGR